ncbi:DUF1996 domain-containing protein [Streptomyces sp. TRM49041]|uniref:DUF1996 domain-containing protein n=1 Tax=Streptomyces sp. TRM49041 TaxID=2603216 RepID=UPI0011EC6415|nr:DUF1996 domain-containing protein [Streptomyces sp. TRM49041]
MGRTRKRSTLANRAIAASAALILGGGGLLAVNVYASAGEGWSGSGDQRERQEQQQVRNASSGMSTIDCPEVADGLPEDMPDRARGEVDLELARIDNRVTDAYQRLAQSREQIAQDPSFAENVILGPLKDERLASIQRIAVAIGRIAERPQGMESLAPCTLRGDENQNQDGDQNQDQNGDQNQDQDQNGDQDQGQGRGQGQAGNGPVANDFVDIRTVQPNVDNPRNQRGASTGSFTSDCGRNENKKFNPDNVIVAPGVRNGAHHMHDYVGNQATDAFSDNRTLARGGTSCRNQGDRSTYYWPVLRVQNGQNDNDLNEDGGGKDQNVGKIQTPAQVTMDFVGSPVSKVTAMPRFLRIITGDAKAFTNGDANANASWSCTGFEDRQLKDKYPLCPPGSKVVRTFKFQSCWDGRNTDSANHRTHVDFADEDGRCKDGFRAIPQLVQRIVYNVSPQANFAVDSFPEQLHKPITDHGDFINVFDRGLMDQMVACINTGRRCA